MKTKNVLPLAVLSFFISSTAIADNQQTGFYLGADVAFANDTELKYSGVSIENSNESGFNAVVGYEFKIEESFKLGGELEYRIFGGNEFYGVVHVDGHAFFANLKPKYTFDSGMYLAGVVGLGQMTMKVKEDEIHYNGEKSDTGYQIGLEGGYYFNDNISLNIGYRSANTEIDNVDIEISGFYAGVRYYF